MDIRTERLKIVYVWLRRNKGLRTQKELAERIGVDQNTISRAMTGKVVASDEVLEQINQSYGNPFNFAWMRGEDDEQFASKKHNVEQQSNTIDLYAKLIQEVESIRRNLNEELDAVRELRAQLSEDVKHLHSTSVLLSHMSVPYPEQPNEHLRAAVPELT